MVEHNLINEIQKKKKKKKKKSFVYHGGFESIFTKKYCNCVLKNVNIFQKLFK